MIIYLLLAYQEIRERSLKKQRDNIVQKQVAVGREFKVSSFLILTSVYQIYNLHKLLRSCVLQGQAFYSKPEVIIFKVTESMFLSYVFSIFLLKCVFQDFDVGKSYRKKIILTNVSFTQNFCKYVGMSEQLLDFIDVM